MVIVWRLRGNIIRTVLYIANVLPLQWAQLTFFVFMYVLFYLGQLGHYPSCRGAGVTNLWAPFEFFAPSLSLRVWAGSIPFRAIVNNKRCEMWGLFVSPVIRDWIGNVQDCQGVSASEMTYIVSGGALNSTHSLTHFYVGLNCDWLIARPVFYLLVNGKQTQNYRINLLSFSRVKWLLAVNGSAVL